MRKIVGTVFLAVIVLTSSTLFSKASLAAETQVNCYAPTAQVSTGLDGTSPRFTIQCSSSNVGNITFFAFKIAQNPVIAEMLQKQYLSFIQEQIQLGLQNSTDVILYTDLSNTSGNAWGCGSSNCRIIDYLTFY